MCMILTMFGLAMFVMIMLLNSTTESKESNSSRWFDSKRDVIYKILRSSVRVDDIVILFDNTTGLFVSDILWNNGGDRNTRTYLTINVDSLTSAEFMDYITRLAQRYIGQYLNFIAVLEDTNLFTVIKQINSIDKNSKKSTNIRHWSTWIIFHHLQVYHPLEHLVRQFDNMIVVYLRNKIDEYTCLGDVVTLVMTNYGPEFQPVDMSRDDIQLFPGLNYGYNGRHFDVLTKTWVSFIEEENLNGKLVYKGYIVDILDYMALKLNFTYDFYNDKESSWNGYINGTKTGLIYRILNGEYDIMGTASMLTEERMEFMDYVFPALYNDKFIPTYRKKPDSSGLLYTKPFQTVVLVSILGCFISVCCILLTAENINPYNNNKEKTPLKDGIFHVAGIILNQGGILKIDSLTGRLLLVSFWFFCIVMGSVYKANLVAFFAYSKPDVFNSLEDILDSDYRMGIVSGSTLFQEFENHSIPVYKRLLENLNTNLRLYPETATADNDVHLANLLDGNYVYIADTASTSYLYANSCDIIRLNTVVYDFISAFGVPKNSSLKFDMEQVMNEVQQSGMLDRWKKKWWPDRPKEFCNTSLRVKQLHLSDIYSIFILLSVCLAVCFCTLCVELIRNQYVSNKFRLHQ